MIYYKSRYLSEKLDINLAKWKRWSREFLDPDPLGGLQSGVARQFNLRDAFKVYLGGCLVSDLKFTIPEALTILTDLSPWLKDNGFLSIESQLRPSVQNKMADHYVYIYAMPQNHFAYPIRTILSVAPKEGLNNAVTEIFAVSHIGVGADPLATGVCVCADVLSITTLYNRFRQQIN